MDDVVSYYSTLMTTATFLSFVVGLRFFQQIPVFRAMYMIMLCGYLCIYSLDFVALFEDAYREPWYLFSRQAIARTIICLAFWCPIWTCFRYPSLLAGMLRLWAHRPQGEPPAGEP